MPTHPDCALRPRPCQAPLPPPAAPHHPLQFSSGSGRAVVRRRMASWRGSCSSSQPCSCSSAAGAGGWCHPGGQRTCTRSSSPATTTRSARTPVGARSRSLSCAGGGSPPAESRAYAAARQSSACKLTLAAHLLPGAGAPLGGPAASLCRTPARLRLASRCAMLSHAARRRTTASSYEICSVRRLALVSDTESVAW